MIVVTQQQFSIFGFKFLRMRLPRAFRSFCETVLSFQFLELADEIATIAAQSRNDDLIADEIATIAAQSRNDDLIADEIATIATQSRNDDLIADEIATIAAQSRNDGEG